MVNVNICLKAQLGYIKGILASPNPFSPVGLAFIAARVKSKVPIHMYLVPAPYIYVNPSSQWAVNIESAVTKFWLINIKSMVCAH